MSFQFKRRAFLAAMPAAVLVGATPVEASPQSPLREIYRQWQEAKAAHRALPDDVSDEEDEASYWRVVRFEEQAAAYEPRTMDDVLMKIVFADDDGAMRGTIFQTALAAQAYRLAGIEAANH